MRGGHKEITKRSIGKREVIEVRGGHTEIAEGVITKKIQIITERLISCKRFKEVNQKSTQ